MSSKTVEEAFEEWAKPYDWIGDDLVAAFAAGATHGAAEEREAVAAIIDVVEADGNIGWHEEGNEIVRRIRQRGEKRDGV